MISFNFWLFSLLDLSVSKMTEETPVVAVDLYISPCSSVGCCLGCFDPVLLVARVLAMAVPSRLFSLSLVFSAFLLSHDAFCTNSYFVRC